MSFTTLCLRPVHVQMADLAHSSALWALAAFTLDTALVLAFRQRMNLFSGTYQEKLQMLRWEISYGGERSLPEHLPYFILHFLLFSVLL